MCLGLSSLSARENRRWPRPWRDPRKPRCHEVAEEVGLEPTRRFRNNRLAVCPLNHSGIPPDRGGDKECRRNERPQALRQSLLKQLQAPFHDICQPGGASCSMVAHPVILFAIGANFVAPLAASDLLAAQGISRMTLATCLLNL